MVDITKNCALLSMLFLNSSSAITISSLFNWEDGTVSGALLPILQNLFIRARAQLMVLICLGLNFA